MTSAALYQGKADEWKKKRDKALEVLLNRYVPKEDRRHAVRAVKQVFDAYEEEQTT